MTENGLYLVRGEYATIERELAELTADYTREVKSCEGFALSLSRNGAVARICGQLETEIARLHRVSVLCEKISGQQARLAELRGLTGWF